MITAIQIGALVFSLFALSRVILRAKDKKINTVELFFWVGVWAILIVTIALPDILSRGAALVGIGRGTDLILYGSIGLLLYLVFRLYVKLEETEREITQLVRERALEKKKK